MIVIQVGRLIIARLLREGVPDRMRRRGTRDDPQRRTRRAAERRPRGT
jgi:hypothetical protein